MRRLDWTDAAIVSGAILVLIGLWQIAPPWALTLIGAVVIVGGLLGSDIFSHRR